MYCQSELIKEVITSRKALLSRSESRRKLPAGPPEFSIESVTVRVTGAQYGNVMGDET